MSVYSAHEVYTVCEQPFKFILSWTLFEFCLSQQIWILEIYLFRFFMLKFDWSMQDTTQLTAVMSKI